MPRPGGLDPVGVETTARIPKGCNPLARGEPPGIIPLANPHPNGMPLFPLLPRAPLFIMLFPLLENPHLNPRSKSCVVRCSSGIVPARGEENGKPASRGRSVGGARDGHSPFLKHPWMIFFWFRWRVRAPGWFGPCERWRDRSWTRRWRRRRVRRLPRPRRWREPGARGRFPPVSGRRRR